MDFAKVLTRAGEIIWRFKVLWIFGVLANCGGQSSNGFRGSRNFDFSDGEIQDLPLWFERFYSQFERYLGSNDQFMPMIVGGLVLLSIVLGLVFFALSVYGRIGLIKGTLQAEAGAETLTFEQLAQDIRPYYRRAFGMNFLVVLAFLLILAIAGFIIVISSIFTLGLAVLCVIPLMCLMIPVGIAVGIVIEQANVALVAEDLDIIPALERGFQIVRENLGSFVVMGIILGIGAGVMGFVISLPIMLAVVPVMFGAFSQGFTDFGGSIFQGLGVTLLCFVIYLPVLLLLSGMLRGYIISAWTLTYQQVTGPANYFEDEEVYEDRDSLDKIGESEEEE